MTFDTDTNAPEQGLSGVEIARVVGLLDKISNDVYSTAPEAPGLALRLDRIERQLESFAKAATALLSMLKWTVGGGALSVVAFLALLYRLGEAAAKVSGVTGG